MANTVEDFKEWYQRGVRKGASHMIMVCDLFDYGDFPVYINVNTPEEARAAALREGAKPMQKVMEVWNMKLPFETQMSQPRAFNY